MPSLSLSLPSFSFFHQTSRQTNRRAMFKLVRDSELRINLFARQGTREMKFNQGRGRGTVSTRPY